MSIKIADLSKDHPIVRAAHRMVEAHQKHETIGYAAEEVHEDFPELTPEQIIVLWVGINAKDRSSDEPFIPVNAIRGIAVEAIRDATGCPDLKGKDGKFLADNIEELARKVAKM